MTEIQKKSGLTREKLGASRNTLSSLSLGKQVEARELEGNLQTKVPRLRPKI